MSASRSGRKPVARPTGGENPGQRYIRVALVHDDATVAAGMQRMLSVL